MFTLLLCTLQMSIPTGSCALKHTPHASASPVRKSAASDEVEEDVSDEITLSSGAALAAADIAGPLATVWEQKVLDRDVLATTWGGFRNNSKPVCTNNASCSGANPF